MPKQIAIREILANLSELPLIDARSEGEFAQGHIRGAISLPLFDNAERAEIGTLYKRQGKQTAILRGLGIVGPKMQDLAEAALATAHSGKIAVHCWRGGMRSASLAWLFERVGLEVYTVIGGYKSYRRLCLERFTAPQPLMVIGGKTGTQKTRIINELAARGENAIDLEGLANHRGSAFGYATDLWQPTQEQFENDLGMALLRSENGKQIYIEDESRLVGRLHVPDSLWKQMRSAPTAVLEWPIEARIDYLVHEYQAASERLAQNLESIKKRLGNERHKAASDALASNDRAEVCRIVLDYYDRAYEHGLAKREPSTLRYISGERALEILTA